MARSYEVLSLNEKYETGGKRMEIKEAVLKSKETGYLLTRRDWMIQNIIPFVIQPKNSGSLGSIIIVNLYQQESTAKELKAKPSIGRFWSPSTEDILADDWELVKLTRQSSHTATFSLQQVAPVLVETH